MWNKCKKSFIWDGVVGNIKDNKSRIPISKSNKLRNFGNKNYSYKKLDKNNNNLPFLNAQNQHGIWNCPT